jgi:hypothetical protein
LSSLTFFELEEESLLELESSESLDEDDEPRLRFLPRFRFFLSFLPSRLFFFFLAFFSPVFPLDSTPSRARLRSSSHFSSNFGSLSSSAWGEAR